MLDILSKAKEKCLYHASLPKTRKHSVMIPKVLPQSLGAKYSRLPIWCSAHRLSHYWRSLEQERALQQVQATSEPKHRLAAQASLQVPQILCHPLWLGKHSCLSLHLRLYSWLHKTSLRRKKKPELCLLVSWFSKWVQTKIQTVAAFNLTQQWPQRIVRKCCKRGT